MVLLIIIILLFVFFGFCGKYMDESGILGSIANFLWYIWKKFWLLMFILPLVVSFLLQLGGAG